MNSNKVYLSLGSNLGDKIRNLQNAINLIDSEAIWESFPAQRSLIFSLENKELCLAYITKDISFDISSLQLNNQTSLLLNIENGENDFQILYEY